jgi:hypothetical protein
MNGKHNTMKTKKDIGALKGKLDVDRTARSKLQVQDRHRRDIANEDARVILGFVRHHGPVLHHRRRQQRKRLIPGDHELSSLDHVVPAVDGRDLAL